MEGVIQEEPVVSSRIFWSGGGWDCPWWKPLILAGIRGGDENCNRTIGLRLPGGALFLCLNIPLRQRKCDECTSASCPGYETSPNVCACRCEGCKTNCAAHQGRKRDDQ